MITEIPGPSLEELRARNRKKERERSFVNVLHRGKLLPMKAVLRVIVCLVCL